MRRSTAAATLVVATLMTTLAATPAWAGDTPPSPEEKTGYTLDFQEEFSSSTLDTSKWMTQYLPHWTDTPADTEARYSIADGVLTQRIDADQPKWDADVEPNLVSSAFQTFNRDYWHKYRSGLVNHSTPLFDGYKTRYGYFEIRAKFGTTGGGGHQAWWLVGTDDASTNSVNPEIDIVESFFSRPNNWRIAAYGWGDPNFIGSWYLSDAAVPSGSPTTEFHKYAMDWTPTQLRFYYDDVLYRTVNEAPNMPMGMILNIYTGAGSGMPNATWPKSWQVDYVRVWKKDGGYGEAYSTIANRSTGELVHVQSGTGLVHVGTVASTSAAAQWEREVNASGFVRYRNKLTGEFIDTWDTATTRVATTSAGWWSSQFTEKPVTGTSYVYLRNRQTTDYLHIHNLTGTVERGFPLAADWTAQWLITAAP